MTVFNSLLSMVPPPSISNTETRKKQQGKRGHSSLRSNEHSPLLRTRKRGAKLGNLLVREFAREHFVVVFLLSIMLDRGLLWHGWASHLVVLLLAGGR